MQQSRKYMKVRDVARDLRQKRIDDKSKRKTSLMMNQANIQVLGSCNHGFSPVLLVQSEGDNFLFNCREGTQRFCHSNRVKLTSLEKVFITNLNWSQLSGTYGLSLTAQDLGNIELSVTGGEGIQDLFKGASSFMVYQTGIKIYTKVYSSGHHSSPSLSVTPIPIESTSSQRLSPASKENGRDRLKRRREPVKLVAYACELPDLPGPLNPDKCRELKVPVGPLLGKLKSGRDVTLADGRVVKSADVTGPTNKGMQFLVIECPSVDHIDSIFDNEDLNRLRDARLSNSSKETSLVAHFSPSEVIQHPKYKYWLDGFPQNCKHLLLSGLDPSTQVSFVESYRMQYLLGKLDDVIFPPLPLTGKFLERSTKELAIVDTEANKGSLVGTIDDDDGIVAYHQRGDLKDLDKLMIPASMDKINLRPKQNLEGVESKISIDTLYRVAELNPDIEDLLADLKRLQKDLPEAMDYEPELVFLGTGSAVPSKLRNTSCILFNFTHPKKFSVIMDCGEDSYGQLLRRFGFEKSCEILQQLRMIYVSHHHADHHIGLVTLLIERYKLTREPLALIIPPGVEKLLNYHNDNFNDISNSYQIISTRQLKIDPKLQESSWTVATQAAKRGTLAITDDILEDLSVVDVDHCVNSTAVVFKFKIGHKDMNTFTVAYSGDARPSEDFCTIGRNCDLLIHEATFDHRAIEDAIIKKHCTCDEAIQVSRSMNAKFTVLSHLSQRLPKIPYFTDMFDDKIGFAFDNLTLRCPSHFGRLPMMKPILKLVFEKSLLEVDQRYRKIERKQDLAKLTAARNELDQYEDEAEMERNL